MLHYCNTPPPRKKELGHLNRLNDQLSMRAGCVLLPLVLNGGGVCLR